MKITDVKKLKAGDEILHRNYGRIKVNRLEWHTLNELFGIVIEPVTDWGRKALLRDSGASQPILMEVTYSRLSHLVPLKQAKDLAKGDCFRFIGRKKAEYVSQNISLGTGANIPDFHKGSHLIIVDTSRQLTLPPDYEVVAL